MRSIIYSVFSVILFLSVTGCIKNDLPYPRIQQNITNLVAEGQSRVALIDSVTRDAVIYLEETADIEKVRFSEFTISDGGSSDINLLEGYYDLTYPLYVVLTRFQSYRWEIRAEQNIERYFSVEGQIGESVIDAAACRVIVTMPENVDLSNLHLENIKIGPAGITSIIPEWRP